MRNQNKYSKIVDDIRTKIKEGALPVGSQIPTEVELAKQYRVSRMTVNKAIGILVQDGYIQRSAGKGSYVCDKVIHKQITSNRSFTKDMDAIGCVASASLIEYRIFHAKDLPMIQEKMNLLNEEYIYYFVRLRYAGETPIAINYTYISSKYIPAFDVNRLKDSLYDYFSELGLYLHDGEGNMTAIMASEDQAELLQCEPCALLRNAHYSYLNTGEALEYTETYYIGNRYEYHYEFINE